MVTPIDPTECVRTGRILTEWFETPELTEDDLWAMSYEKYGVDPETHNRNKQAADMDEIDRKITQFVAARKRRTWGVNGMTKQEVQYRMNEATKMIDPDNRKFLDNETRERTGLEINPLWMMECIVRSGVLSPKEMMAGLKELAGYTHSKAPTIQNNTNVNVAPEDWLLELAKDEYETVDDAEVIPEPKQRIERGYGKKIESRHTKRVQDTAKLVAHNELTFKELMKEVDNDESFTEVVNIHEMMKHEELNELE